MIKVGRINVESKWNMLEDWTSSLRIGRCVSRRHCAMTLSIKPRRSNIVPRRLGVAGRQHADWAICRRRGRCTEGLNEVSDEPMICWTFD